MGRLNNPVGANDRWTPPHHTSWQRSCKLPHTWAITPRYVSAPRIDVRHYFSWGIRVYLVHRLETGTSTTHPCKYSDTWHCTRRYLSKTLGPRVGVSQSGPGYNNGYLVRRVQWGQCARGSLLLPGRPSVHYKYWRFYEVLTPKLGSFNVVCEREVTVRAGSWRRGSKGWDGCHCDRGWRLGLFEPPRGSGAELRGGTFIETDYERESSFGREYYCSREYFHSFILVWV